MCVCVCVFVPKRRPAPDASFGYRIDFGASDTAGVGSLGPCWTLYLQKKKSKVQAERNENPTPVQSVLVLHRDMSNGCMHGMVKHSKKEEDIFVPVYGFSAFLQLGSFSVFFFFLLIRFSPLQRMRTPPKRRKVIGFCELCSWDMSKDHGANHETLFQCLVNDLIAAPTSSFSEKIIRFYYTFTVKKRTFHCGRI